MSFFFGDLISIAWGLLILAILGILFVTWSDLKGAPFVTTPRSTVRKMLELAEIGPQDTLYDLGSGDGRVLIIAAREYGARAVGIEIDPLRYAWTRLMIRLYGLQGQVSVQRGNFFDQDLSPASLIVCFLLQSTNDRLQKKLLTELRPGTRIISRKYEFQGWKPNRKNEELRLFYYAVPDKSN